MDSSGQLPLVPDLWAHIFSFLLGETLFEDHVDLGVACSVLSTDIRKSWLTVEDLCIRTTHAVYRRIANVRVDGNLLRKFMYAKARKFRKAEEERDATLTRKDPLHVPQCDLP